MGGGGYQSQEDEAAPASEPSSAAQTPSTAERGMLAEALDASTLSYSTRIKGFAACFVLGAVISVLALVTFSITLNLFTFGVLYTLGNVVALASTLFLMGPTNQIKRMFAKERWAVSTAVLVLLALTLFSAFYLHKKGLTILFCLLQFCAMTWYALSYIPFARDAVIKAFDKIVG